jgi:hypothetical protein
VAALIVAAAAIDPRIVAKPGTVIVGTVIDTGAHIAVGDAAAHAERDAGENREGKEGRMEEFHG